MQIVELRQLNNKHHLIFLLLLFRDNFCLGVKFSIFILLWKNNKTSKDCRRVQVLVAINARNLDFISYQSARPTFNEEQDVTIFFLSRKLLFSLSRVSLSSHYSTHRYPQVLYGNMFYLLVLSVYHSIWHTVDSMSSGNITNTYYLSLYKTMEFYLKCYHCYSFLPFKTVHALRKSLLIYFQYSATISLGVTNYQGVWFLRDHLVQQSLHILTCVSSHNLNSCLPSPVTHYSSIV